MVRWPAARSLALGALSLVLGVALNGCTGGSGESATQLAIGIDLPVSGADTSDGVPTRNGAILAIEQANAGHVFGPHFTLVANDLDDAVNGKHDPAQGAQNVKTFIADDRVLAMVGPFNSSVATAEIPLTNDAGLAQISPSATADSLTLGAAGAQLRRSHPDVPTFFRICATNARQGDADARFAQHLGYKRVAVVDDNETYGLGLADVFATRFSALGGTVLSREHITANQQDFKALLTKIQAAKPDLVFFGGTTSTGGGLLRKQMGDVNLGTTAFMGGDGVSDDEFLHVTGSMANGVAYTIVAPEVTHLPLAQKFVRDYTTRFKAPVGPYSANAYVAAQIEIAAIAAEITLHPGVRPERAAVLARVAATTHFVSPIGTVGFNAAGDTNTPIISLYQIVGGKPQFVRQVTVQ